jgi:excisionase family DNA binding protein
MRKANREKRPTTDRADKGLVDQIEWSLTGGTQVTTLRGDLNGLPVFVMLELGPWGHRPIRVAEDIQLAIEVADAPKVTSAYNLGDWPRRYFEARTKAEFKISEDNHQKRMEASDAEYKAIEDAKAALPKYMTMPEVVEASRFSIDTVRKAIKEGRLIASQPEGREWRILRQDFDAWMGRKPPVTETLLVEHPDAQRVRVWLAGPVADIKILTGDDVLDAMEWTSPRTPMVHEAVGGLMESLGWTSRLREGLVVFDRPSAVDQTLGGQDQLPT